MGSAGSAAAGSSGLVSGGTSATGLSKGPTNAAANTAAPGSGSLQFHGRPRRNCCFLRGVFERKQVPLSAFSRVELAASPITVNHQGQFPVVTLSFNLAPSASLGNAVQAVERAKDEIGLPASIQAGFQGTAAAFQGSLSNEVFLILAALVTVYIVLGVLYESYIHPLTILSTLPSAGVGALLALLITGNDFSVIALIGIVLLDRHREEKRHHDDRLRARRRAQ